MFVTAGESQNLPRSLEQTEALYSDASARLPVTGAMIARQARHFAATVRLSRGEPEAMRRLGDVTGGLGDVPSLSSLLPRVLDGALSLMGADFGTLQVLDPVTGSLRLVTQSGLDPGFLEYFAVVDDGHSACGRAARKGTQVVIADTDTDPGFAPHRGVAAASGFRAVQSTPLADKAGHLVGVVSTHFRRPCCPADLDLQIMELYADVAGQAIADHLGRLGDEGPRNPIGRAVVAALSGAGAGHSSPGADPGRRAAYPDDTIGHFAEYVVKQLFSVGLSLDSAHSIAGKGPAGDRVGAAIDLVDRLIRDVRDQLFQLEERERAAKSLDRVALLHERMARVARALQASAADYAELLEQSAGLSGLPGRVDYPTEIKRWRAFADQAEQMAKRWEFTDRAD
jgi:hypothetical protein